MTCEHLDIDDMLRKLTAPRRNHYYYGKMLDVLHFQMEQRYLNQKRWLINRLSLGDGILCGLGVEAEGDKVCIDCGVAVDCLGREVIVPQRFCIDPWKLLDACGNPSGELSRREAHVITLSICYHECLTDYAPILVSTCETKDECHPGTVVESYRPQIDVGEARPPEPSFDPACCRELVGGAPPSDAPTVTGTFTVVDTLSIAGRPTAVAATADGQWVVVASQAGAPIHVVSVASHAVSPISADVIAVPSGHVAAASSGGPAFVTHGAGIAVVDPSASASSIQHNLMADRSYGACAAVDEGKRVFAVNVPKRIVEIVDVASESVVGVIEVPGLPRDLAVSPDETHLYILAGDAPTMWRAKVAEPSNVNEIALGADPPATIAARGTASGDELYATAGATVHVVDANGDVSSFPPQPNLDAIDSAFTSNGEGYYVTHRASGNDEVVVMKPDTLEIVARLPVGGEPTGVAVVPGRVRAYIANRRTGTVSVIDAETKPSAGDCRRSPCCEVEGCCVLLAQIELRPGGTIGAIETKGLRKPIYSNRMLMEMIHCLADKLRDCCDDDDPPPPTDDTLRVEGVDFIGDGVSLGSLADPAQPQVVAGAVDAVVITFTEPLLAGSATALPPKTATVRVERADGSFVKGNLVVNPAQVVTWRPDEALGDGSYVFFVYGDPDPGSGRDAIRASNGDSLDGEPLNLPSGNATPGGDFTFKLQIG